MYQQKEVYSGETRQVSQQETADQATQAFCIEAEELKNTKHQLPTGNSDSLCPVASDGTSITEFYIVNNKKYSEEIIHNVRTVYNPEKLIGLKDNQEEYLCEGKAQINALWQCIHSLDIHTQMFTVLFLIAIGCILQEIRKSFEHPHEFARWRDSSFGSRHKRLFQEAVQLAEMGDFPKRYAAIGKTRILQLETIRKADCKSSCEDILRESSAYKIISESALPHEVVEKLNIEPFPDISFDEDNQRVKNYVSSIITRKRLENSGIDYADFDQAQLITEYYGEAIPANEIKRIKTILNKADEADRPEIFSNLVMDRMKNTPVDVRDSRSIYSLNKVIADFIRYCRKINFGDREWIERQKVLIDGNSVRQAMDYLNQIILSLELDTEENISQYFNHQGGLKQ